MRIRKMNILINTLDKSKGGFGMEVYVDPDLCISCGNCIDICPEVFDWDEEGKARSLFDEVPQELEECATEAMENCPVDAIKNAS
jgi:ferredoxin